VSRTNTHIAGFVVGYGLVRLVFVVLALVAALPGLGGLLRGIKTAGLSSHIFYPLLTHYLPMFMTAFVVGWIAYRLLGGFRVGLFLALAAPWFLMGGQACLVVAEESLFDCWRFSDPFAFVLGVVVVPLGLMLAALVHVSREEGR
jgi:hypothetical protein